MEENRAGQPRGVEDFLLDNRPTSLDTSLSLGRQENPTMDNPKNLLAMNHSGQLNEAENEDLNSANVANNQALLLSDFGSPSYDVNGFGHGIALSPVGLDQTWFNNNVNADMFDHRHNYRQQENKNAPSQSMTRRNGLRRRNVSAAKRVCNRCGTTTTPMWRRGPDGPQTHCNACGLWYARLFKK